MFQSSNNFSKKKMTINPEKISNNFGFMDYEPKTNTFEFKSKVINVLNKRKTKGEKNKTEVFKLTQDINNLLKLAFKNEKSKYELDKTVRFSKINNINKIAFDKIDEIDEDINNTNKKQIEKYIKVNTPFQMYIEKELLYRLLEEKQIENKKWFFHSLENFYNNVKDL